MNIEIILTGSFGVGKSSLFNRFIYEDFNDKYYGTIGVRVNERKLKVKETPIGLKLWDVAGEVKQEKVPLNYFDGKDMVLYVIDLSRPFTFTNVPNDIAYIKNVAPNSALRVVGNKKDILKPEKLSKLQNEIPFQFDFLTSAKTGEGVEDLFLSIAKEQISISIK